MWETQIQVELKASHGCIPKALSLLSNIIMDIYYITYTNGQATLTTINNVATILGGRELSFEHNYVLFSTQHWLYHVPRINIVTLGTCINVDGCIIEKCTLMTS